ncbi:MAG: ABC transporter permease subunit [Asgard group archaeon]|nr:ABC transporter permease subunit [Asgard group archaeon]
MGAEKVSRVLTKDLQKKWLSGIIPPISVIAFIPLIASIWPEFKKQADNFADILDNPIYQAILGQLGLADITTWTGFFYMYIFLTLEIVVIFLSVLLPVRIISKEVDKKTLDLVLSYPIPRWRFLLEKFSVYLIYNLAYPILVLFFTFVSTRIVGEEINYTLLTYSSIGILMQLFAL